MLPRTQETLGRTVIHAHPRSQRAVVEAFCPAGAAQTLALSERCSGSGGSPVSLTSVGTLVGPEGRRGTGKAFVFPQEKGQEQGSCGRGRELSVLDVSRGILEGKRDVSGNRHEAEEKGTWGDSHGGGGWRHKHAGPPHMCVAASLLGAGPAHWAGL